MSAPQILILLAAVFAVVEQFEARGRSLLAWAVLLVCVALMWGWLG